jgi:hypothetical protein
MIWGFGPACLDIFLGLSHVTAFRSKNNGSFGYDLKKRKSRVAVGLARKRTLTAKSVSVKHRSKFAHLSLVMMAAAR